MKVVIGIVLISLVILGLIAYMILMLNAREMIFCGDLKNENGTNAQITRVYTTDLNANEQEPLSLSVVERRYTGVSRTGAPLIFLYLIF